MLELLKLTEVGPVRQVKWKLAERLNLITGDNGLGKTFLLECSWWALTGTWARKYQAYPRKNNATNSPGITFRLNGKSTVKKEHLAEYDWKKQTWKEAGGRGRDLSQDLVIFAQADDSITVWDPAKYLADAKGDPNGGLTSFSLQDIFDGLSEKQDDRTRVICNGLIRDWVSWQFRPEKSPFDQFTAVLKALAPHPSEEPLIPGQPTRLSVYDVREIPTLKFAYDEVPILLCSAGIQRIVSLAYVLVWAWNEHVEASRLMRKEPQKNIVLLIDEMEAHLHPFWQRVIIPALMDVVQVLEKDVQSQLIITTHSPLVLASIEDRFEQGKDKLFRIYIDQNEVTLDPVPFVKRGRVDLWLMSNLFGLKQPRSKIAEETIEEAKRLQELREPSKDEVQEVTDKLIRVLAQDDEFWPRWTYFAQQRGVLL